MALTGDPIANGLVESLSRPGGNVTGMSGVNAQLGGKCAELIREMLPLAHLYGPAVRCKPEVMIWRLLVLRFCIRPLSGAFALLAIMDIRAHLFSFASRP
jgi:hypothetical protein